MASTSQEGGPAGIAVVGTYDGGLVGWEIHPSRLKMVSTGGSGSGGGSGWWW